MNTQKMAETAARYGLTMTGLEDLLHELGWMSGGEWQPGPVDDGFLTVDRELTIEGQGFLAGYLWRR